MGVLVNIISCWQYCVRSMPDSRLQSKKKSNKILIKDLEITILIPIFMRRKFILNCPDDSLTLSKKTIFGKTFLWLVILFACAVVVRMICMAIYMANGLNPMELTQFGGDPTSRLGQGIGKTLLSLLIIAPLLEEALFRLPLSFKRTTVALWLALIPIISAFYFHKCRVWYILLALAAVGAIIYYLVYRFTTDEQWEKWREKFIIWAMWIAAISFGLMHLRAFSVLNLQVLPWALATILVPMAGGCAVTYARVNLGFFWGVFFHMLINIPGIFAIIAGSLAG